MTHDTPPKRIWTFDRYVNGILMAEGVEIGKAETFEQAAKAAVRLASSGPKGEAPVLVLRDTSEADAMVAAVLREAARTGDRFIIPSLTPIMQISEMQLGRDAAAQEMQQRILALIPQPASAALDRAILEAKTEVAAILGVTTARDTMTGEPVMWGDEDGDCLTPEIAVQCALDKLIAEAVKAERGRCAKIADYHAERFAEATYKTEDGRLQNAAKVYGADEIAAAIRAANGDQT